jgi:hypothetical protein
MWEVKTGGGLNNTGYEWPAQSTLDYGEAQAGWYAYRQNGRGGLADKLSNGWWQRGSEFNDYPVGVTMALCGYTCTVSFSDGVLMDIQNPQPGVLSYKYHPGTTITNPRTVTVSNIYNANGDSIRWLLPAFLGDPELTWTGVPSWNPGSSGSPIEDPIGDPVLA